jgi:hypothetical protein
VDASLNDKDLDCVRVLLVSGRPQEFFVSRQLAKRTDCHCHFVKSQQEVAVNGLAHGGGSEITEAAPLAIASERASLPLNIEPLLQGAYGSMTLFPRMARAPRCSWPAESVLHLPQRPRAGFSCSTPFEFLRKQRS